MNLRGKLVGLGTSALVAAACFAGCSSSPSNSSAGSTTSTTAASTSSTVSTSTSTSTAGTTSTSAATSGAACTHSAILTAATADTSLGPVDAVVGFGCSGPWAYANVTVGGGSASYDAVIVLQSQGSSWSVADRASACSNHLVPSDIYTQACTTS